LVKIKTVKASKLQDQHEVKSIFDPIFYITSESLLSLGLLLIVASTLMTTLSKIIKNKYSRHTFTAMTLTTIQFGCVYLNLMNC